MVRILVETRSVPLDCLLYTGTKAEWAFIDIALGKSWEDQVDCALLQKDAKRVGGIMAVSLHQPDADPITGFSKSFLEAFPPDWSKLTDYPSWSKLMLDQPLCY